MTTMSDVYAEMKDVLKFFGLSFHQMDQVTMQIVELNGEFFLCFTHGSRIIHVAIS